MTDLNAMGVQKSSQIYLLLWVGIIATVFTTSQMVTFMKVNTKTVYHQVMELTLTKMEIYMLANSKGLAHGIGTYTFAGGREKYTGNWKDDKRHGKGINTHSTRQEYVGEYERGVRKYGILSLENGDRYVGNFKDDRYHGQGTYTFADGTKYEGIWREGEFLYENIAVTKEDEKFCQEIGFKVDTPEYDNCVQKSAEKD